MAERKIDLAQVPCCRCGNCCRNMGLPPFITACGESAPTGKAGESYATALEMTMSGIDINDQKGCCWWFDEDTNACLFYDQRPQGCRDFQCHA